MYIPVGAPGYMDELQTHKAKKNKAKAAKTRRHGAIRKRIAAARSKVAAAGTAATRETAVSMDTVEPLGTPEQAPALSLDATQTDATNGGPPLSSLATIASTVVTGGGQPNDFEMSDEPNVAPPAHTAVALHTSALPAAAPPTAPPTAALPTAPTSSATTATAAPPTAPTSSATTASSASTLVDTGAWCRIDPVEVAAARAALQEGVFDCSLAAKVAAPELPKFPRRPEPVVDPAEHARRQLEHECARAEVERLRAEHAEQMAERAAQRAAELHRLRQVCQSKASLVFYNLEWRQAELNAVFPSKFTADFVHRKPEELKRLHLQYCCPPVDSQAWRNPRSFEWNRLPPAYFHHHTGDTAQSATAECDRRRKLLGVERLGPHAAAEAAYGGSFTRIPGMAEPAAWRDWVLLSVHRRVHGISPTLTCTRHRCGCEAVSRAPPLKLTVNMLDNPNVPNVRRSDEELRRKLLAKAAELEAEGIPVDRVHLHQMCKLLADAAELEVEGVLVRIDHAALHRLCEQFRSCDMFALGADSVIVRWDCRFCGFNHNVTHAVCDALTMRASGYICSCRIRCTGCGTYGDSPYAAFVDPLPRSRADSQGFHEGRCEVCSPVCVFCFSCDLVDFRMLVPEGGIGICGPCVQETSEEEIVEETDQRRADVGQGLAQRLAFCICEDALGAA